MTATQVETLFTVGDTAPDLTGTVSANLTGATSVKAHVLKPDGTIINRAVTPVDLVAGTWSLAWIVGDLNQRGEYYVEVEVTFASGKIQTFKRDATADEVRFYVDDQYA